MKNENTVHPIELALLALVLRRPSRPPVPAAAPLVAPPAAPWCPPMPPGLEALTVAQLRAAARAEGLPRTLSRSGRRGDLLVALAAAAMAW